MRGAYSSIAVVGHGAHGKQAEPVEDTLFFAGEATDAYQAGTVADALASGTRAAEQVLRCLLLFWI